MTEERSGGIRLNPKDDDIYSYGDKLYTDYNSSSKDDDTYNYGDARAELDRDYNPADYSSPKKHIARPAGDPTADKCFIATEVYGNTQHPDVNELRKFRDFTLQHFPLGKKFIQSYYDGNGKEIANLIRYKVPYLKPLIKYFLKRFVCFLPNYSYLHKEHHNQILKELELDSRSYTDSAIQFIKVESQKRNFKKLLVALSGGVDSATVAVLCKLTGLDIKLVTVYSDNMRKKDLADAKIVANYLGLEHKLIDANLVNKVFKNSNNLIQNHLHMGARRALIYGLAEEDERLLIGSGNKSEELIENFCSNNVLGDIFPIGNLYKVQVSQLASFLGLPENISNKISHCGIEGKLDDEELLGIKFERFDTIAFLLDNKKWKPRKVAKYLGLDLEYIKNIKTIIDIGKAKMQFPSFEFKK